MNPGRRAKLLRLIDGAIALFGQADALRRELDGLRERLVELDRPIAQRSADARRFDWLNPAADGGGNNTVAVEYRRLVAERQATADEIERLHGELEAAVARANEAADPVKALCEDLAGARFAMGDRPARDLSVHELRSKVLSA